MKRALCGSNEQALLPDELWDVVWQRFAPIQLEQWRIVCKHWHRLIPLSVTRIRSWEATHISPRSIGQCVNLQRLCLKSRWDMPVHMTDEHISGLVSLRALCLKRAAHVTGRALVGLTNLTSLNLKSNPVILVCDLVNLTGLRSLNLVSNTVVDCTEELFTRLTALQSLGVKNNRRIRDSVLCQLTNLRVLDISAAKLITGQALLGMTRLRCLTISWYKQASYNLPRVPSLRALRVIGNGAIDDEELSLLTHLVELRLCCNKQITGAGIHALTNLTSLQSCSNAFAFEDLVGMTRLYTLLLSAKHTKLDWSILADLSPSLRHIGLIGRCYDDTELDLELMRACFPRTSIHCEYKCHQCRCG